MRAIIVIIGAIALSGCSRQWCETRYPVSVSTSYIEKIDTSWLLMPADTELIMIPADCPDQQVKVKDGGKETKIMIKNKIITIERRSKADSIQILSLKSKLLEQKIKIVEKPTPIVPGWVRKLLLAELITAISIIIYWQRKRLIPLIIRLIKPF